jgi:hypothetical protein
MTPLLAGAILLPLGFTKITTGCAAGRETLGAEGGNADFIRACDVGENPTCV